MLVNQKIPTMPQTMPEQGKFSLVSLPYGPHDLEPVISSETLALHHGKHLQTYVNNLNRLLPGSKLEGKSLEHIVCNSTGSIFNNAGQILNHNMYFTQFTKPNTGARPSREIAAAIIHQYHSFQAFKDEFEENAKTLFGSGWTWLSVNAHGSLEITQEPNAGNPMQRGCIPLLTFDVWEHAYYLDYQNRRPAHVSSLWDIIDWDVIASRYTHI